MKSLLLFLFIFTIAAAGCKSKALTFNNKVAGIESSIRPDAQKAQEKIQGYLQNQEWDKIPGTAKKIETELNDKISELKDYETPKLDGADDLKQAEVDYLTAIKKMFTSYRKIGEAESDMDRQTEYNNLQQIASNVDQARNDVKQAQQTFAKANKLKVEGQDETTDDDKPTKKKKTTDDTE